MLYAAFLGELQQTLHRVDVVLPVKLVYRVRSLNALVNSRGEDESVAAPEIAAQLVVAHFKIVAVFDLHLRRKHGALRKRRKRNGYDLVTSFDKNLCGFAS